MQIVFDKFTGKIIGQIPDDQNPFFNFKHQSKEFLSTLSSITVDERLENNTYYYVEYDKLMKYSMNEIDEINQHGRVLSEEERLDILLQPSQEEIQKAESTLEILETLQEVGLI